MPLVGTKRMLEEATAEGYCVGAFNIVDYLQMEAVVRAAERRQAPVIIQTSTSTVRRYGPPMIVEWARALADRSPVPIALHMDHGTDRTLIHDCIVSGYTSVMIDASHHPFEENVRLTQDVVEEAHEHGVAVEGEIGVIAGVEEEIQVAADEARYTTPEEAVEFQERTGVDSLAVAIGTAHGVGEVEPQLNLGALSAIHARVDFPLVIHGGSGLSFPVVRQLVERGAAKFNVSTNLKRTYIDALYEYIGDHREEYNPLKLLGYAQDQLVDMLAGYIEKLGSAGRANRS